MKSRLTKMNERGECMNYDTHSVRSGNYHTLTLTTPVAMGKEPGDYEGLTNKPKINGVELVGDVSLDQLGIPDSVAKEPLTTTELDEIVEGE